MFFLLTVTCLLFPAVSFAKCANMQHFFCASGVFQKSDPKLKKAGQFPGHCAGVFEFSGRSAGIVYQDKGECPEPNTPIIGHLFSICQDTGKWTDATYWFANRPQFCTKSYRDRMNEARVLAGQIKEGSTRAEVRKLLKSYEFIGGGVDSVFTEQYYGHPDVVIEVPFEQPGGNYSSENKVNGPVMIKKIELPRP